MLEHLRSFDRYEGEVPRARARAFLASSPALSKAAFFCPLTAGRALVISACNPLWADAYCASSFSPAAFNGTAELAGFGLADTVPAPMTSPSPRKRMRDRFTVSMTVQTWDRMVLFHPSARKFLFAARTGMRERAFANREPVSWWRLIDRGLKSPTTFKKSRLRWMARWREFPQL